ncbi:hypothetical protein B0O80DRAFT_169705 [Mortierella sp. GBAus27b]|nr:hypothetical protein BGX31_000553 [Mortierella sp. GBA43]KAI8349091.1 hypothetical protein B0O80DRAFT_169705 [Mortierella sp. GBAus27b]
MRGERIVWTPEEDEHLRKAVHIYGDKTEKWAKIAACVPGRTNKNCRKRWFHSLDPRLKKGGWTEEEDQLLRMGVQKFRGQWSKIAERIQGRTDDQCAKRWRESLDPDIDRAAWTPEEDLLLLKKFEEHGTQWQKIALSFPGRPGLHCRNRWRKIQRSLNQMERANKRRRHQLGMDGPSGTLCLVDGRSDYDCETRSTSDDVLMQDSFLNDACGLLEDSSDPLDERGDPGTDEERPYGCAIPDCRFESSSPSLLYYHFKASHHGTTILKPFRCTMPGCEDRKRYKNINGLQYHVTHAKNTPGHLGHGIPQQENRRPSTTSSSSDKADDPVPSSSSGTFGSMVIPTANLANSLLVPPLPTPAEIQSVISPFVPQPMVTHQAFNIPQSPESLGDASMHSPDMAVDVPAQLSSKPLQCPELGCGQAFQALTGLTAHMASNHGHQSMVMESNDAAFGTDSIVIPENNFDDLDLDLGFFPSESASPIDTNLLWMDDPQQLQFQLDDLSAEHAALVRDLEASRNAQQDLDLLTINELLFANYITQSLNNLGPYSNRVHFGTHINVSANDPFSLPSTPFTSANVSPQLRAINIPAGNGAITSTNLAMPAVVSPLPTAAAAMASVTATVKRFPCLAEDCLKTYASNSAMRAHLRNEHPDVYPKTSRNTNTASSSATKTNGSSCVRETGACMNSSTNVSSPPSQLLSELATAGTATKLQQKQATKKTEDPSGKPFKCLVPECGKGYTNINGLKNHLLQAHGSTPKKNANTATTTATTTAATAVRARTAAVIITPAAVPSS